MARRPFSGTFARNPKPAAPTVVEGHAEGQKDATPASGVAGNEAVTSKGVFVPSDINTSLEQLAKSVQHLREAVDYRLKLDENQGELRSEFNRMNDERKRLAARLDQAEGRGQAMQQVNQDVSQRLAAAMETIRIVLENQAK